MFDMRNIMQVEIDNRNRQAQQGNSIISEVRRIASDFNKQRKPRQQRKNS